MHKFKVLRIQSENQLVQVSERQPSEEVKGQVLVTWAPQWETAGTGSQRTCLQSENGENRNRIQPATILLACLFPVIKSPFTLKIARGRTFLKASSMSSTLPLNCPIAAKAFALLQSLKLALENRTRRLPHNSNAHLKKLRTSNKVTHLQQSHTPRTKSHTSNKVSCSSCINSSASLSPWTASSIPHHTLFRPE